MRTLILGLTAIILAATGSLISGGAANADAPNGTYTLNPHANSHASLVGQQSSQITQNGQFVSGNGSNLSIGDQTTYPGSRADIVQAALGHSAKAVANPSCASRAEFSRIRVGMPVRTTQSIIGSPGQVSMAGSFMSQRQWRVCGSPYSWVTLTYTQGRLDNKILL
jgi:hypothetical protein